VPLGVKGRGRSAKDAQLFAKVRPKLDSVPFPCLLPWDPVSQFMAQSATDDVIFRLIFTDRHRGHSE